MGIKKGPDGFVVSTTEFDGEPAVLVYHRMLFNHPPLGPTPNQLKNIIIFHDESKFQANDDETWIWGEKGQHVLKPKSRGSGIMFSDFIDEKNGYLKLTDEFQIAKATARKYGKEHEGYWTTEQFLSLLKTAVTIAQMKYPRDQGYRMYIVFEHSSYHGTSASDALDASKMNAKSSRRCMTHIGMGSYRKWCFLMADQSDIEGKKHQY